MRLTNEQREQELELRRQHSMRVVAEIAGLPLGIVKAIIIPSGLFADNPRHRATFTLPPRQSSRETLPTVPELPPQQVVTGDKEIDALLWLAQVIERYIYDFQISSLRPRTQSWSGTIIEPITPSARSAKTCSCCDIESASIWIADLATRTARNTSCVNDSRR